MWRFRSSENWAEHTLQQRVSLRQDVDERIPAWAAWSFHWSVSVRRAPTSKSVQKSRNSDLDIAGVRPGSVGTYAEQVSTNLQTIGSCVSMTSNSQSRMKNRVAPCTLALASGSADTLDALLSACSEMERRYTNPRCLGWPSAVVSVRLVAYSAKQQSMTCALCLENLAAVYLRLQRGRPLCLRPSRM